MNYIFTLITCCFLQTIFLLDSQEMNDKYFVKIQEGINEAKRVPLSYGNNEKIWFDVYLVDLDYSEISIHHMAENGTKIKTIENLENNFLGKGKKLSFATNAGIFNMNMEPEGLLVAGGEELYPLNLKEEKERFTNFYSLAPNGVFYIQDDNNYGIVPREEYNKLSNVKIATQSAPMLIVDDEEPHRKINKAFSKNSESKYIRNGVGVSKEKNQIMGKYELVFAISNSPVNFFNFSRIFKYYGCEQALYLDGAISEMYLPEYSNVMPREKTKNEFASIIAITE